MEIKNLNMNALQAAAQFTSTDETRWILTGVAIYSEDLFVATNSYVLGVVGRQGEKPGDLFKRLGEAARNSEPVVLGRKDIASAVKMAKKGRDAQYRSFNLGREGRNITVTYGVTDSEYAPEAVSVFQHIEGDYPRLTSLIPTEQPAAVRTIGLSTTFITDICKAVKFVSEPRVETPIVFDGGTDERKPVFWHAAGGLGTLCVLQMPVRAGDAGFGWTDEQVKAA